MFRKYLILVVFVLGVLIFSYPIVSNWFSTQDHYTMMSQHNEAWENMSSEMQEKVAEEAKAYNQAIPESDFAYVDPFSDDAPDEEANPHYFNMLDIGESMGSIEIPKIDVKIPIYHGVSEDVLRQGIGHLSNSSLPTGGEGTHAALTGHRGLPSSKLFRELDKMDVGDVFYIHSLGETLAYEVNEVDIVLPSETSWLSIEPDQDLVTLITCEPYMINTHRLLVHAERVPYEVEEETVAAAGLSPSPGVETSNINWVYIGIPLLLVAVVLAWMIKRRIGRDRV